MASRIERRWHGIALLGIAALAFFCGCQKDKPVRPATDASLRLERLEVGRASIAPTDSTILRAWVVEGPEPGTPVSGAAVDFTELSNRAAGTFSKAQAVTDAQGWATSIYRAAQGDSGNVTLKAAAGSSVKYAIVQVTPVPVVGVLLTFSTPLGATALAADGRSIIEVTVTATQGSNRIPAANLPIVLTAGDQFEDANFNGIFDGTDTVIANGDRNNNGTWDAEGTVPDRVMTDAGGTATFSFQAGTTVGPVFVRATGGGATTELRLYQHSLSLQIALTPGVRDLLADGVSQCPVSLTVKDWNDTPIGGILIKLVAGEPFDDHDGDGFYSTGTDQFTDQNGNGRWDAIGEITSVVTTNQDGSASAVYEAGRIPGTVTIQATAPGSAGSSSAGIAAVHLIPLSPAHTVALACEQGELYADGASELEGSVTVRDINGNLLAGKSVVLTAGERFDDADRDGIFTAGVDQLLDDADGNGTWSAIGTIPAEAITSADGSATFRYQAGLRPAQVWIRAAVDSITTETQVVLRELPATYAVNVVPAFDRITISGGGGLDNTRITASCFDLLGRPSPAGVPVSFSIVSGPGGGEHLDGAVSGVYQAHTDGSGQATAVLMAGTVPGLVQVGASSGSVIGSAGVYVGAGLAAEISCRADSVSLVENSSCTVYAFVYDQAHNAVRDGTVVLFHSDEGLLVGDEPGGSSRTVNGTAKATFVAVPDQQGGDGAAEVVAETNGGVNGGIACTSVIQLPPPSGGICRIALSSEYPEIGVKGTGAPHELSALYARGYDCHGAPVGAGRSITFRIVRGPGGGEALASCQCDTAVVLTDAGGLATVVLASGTVSGTVLVSAEPTGQPGVATNCSIGIAAGPPAGISVGVEKCNVLACGRVNESNPVVALVYDAYHNPVKDGTDVWFTSNMGMVEGNQGLGHALTSRGHATGTWWSDGTCGLTQITASTAGGGTVDDQVLFIGSGMAYSTRFVMPADSVVDLAADAHSRLELKVEVLDQNGLYTLPGNVDFRATYGTVTQQAMTDDGCHASLATTEYTSAALSSDDSYTVPDDGIGAVDVVTAGAGYGGNGDQIAVRLHTSYSSPEKSSIDLTTVPPGELSIFSVTIRDANNNPLGGHVLAITATGGTIDPTGTTNAAGLATGLHFTAPAQEGTVMVEVRDMDPGYSGDLIMRKAVTIKIPS